MDDKEIEQEYVIITYKDFADLVDVNGVPIHTPTNNSSIISNIMKLHNMYSYGTFLYYYSPTILKTTLFVLRVL